MVHTLILTESICELPTSNWDRSCRCTICDNVIWLWGDVTPPTVNVKRETDRTSSVLIYNYLVCFGALSKWKYWKGHIVGSMQTEQTLDVTAWSCDHWLWLRGYTCMTSLSTISLFKVKWHVCTVITYLYETIPCICHLRCGCRRGHQGSFVEWKKEVLAQFIRNLRLHINVHEEFESLIVDWLKTKQT